MPHATVPSPGLQALILCGPGVSLNTFTSTPKDFPKALVPIANRPMVWYPLEWCHRMGISDITLITPYESASALESALATHPALTSLPKPQPEIVAPVSLRQTTGTGELLQLPEVQKVITSDFVVLPCDLVSELEGTKLLQQWMILNSASLSGAKNTKSGLGVFYPTQGLEGISTKKDETDFVATISLPRPPVPPPHNSLRTDIEQVVLSMPTDTLNDKLEEDKGFFRLRQRLLSRHGRSRMRMKHRDAHVYVFPHWVKDFVARNDKFDSISEDVVGWWAKAGWQDGLVEKLGLDEVLGKEATTNGSEDGQNGYMDDEDDEVDPASLSSTKIAPPVEQPASTRFASRVGNLAPPQKSPLDLPPFLAYIQPAPAPDATITANPSPLIRRVDTTAQLASISLYIARQAPTQHPLAPEHKIHPTASVGLQTRVSAEDSLIGENVRLGIRCNVKESVVGANCELGDNVRLTKCVLMDGVKVGDGVVMSGCVIGRRARITGMKKPDAPDAAEGAEKPKKKGKRDDDDDEKTKLTDCEVAPGFVVEAGTEAKGEKFMVFDPEGFEDEEEETSEVETGDGSENDSD